MSRKVLYQEVTDNTARSFIAVSHNTVKYQRFGIDAIVYYYSKIGWKTRFCNPDCDSALNSGNGFSPASIIKYYTDARKNHKLARLGAYSWTRGEAIIT